MGEKFIDEFWALKPDKLLLLDDTAATGKIYGQYGKMKPGKVYSPRRRRGTRKPLAKEERYLKSLLSMKLDWANDYFIGQSANEYYCNWFRDYYKGARPSKSDDVWHKLVTGAHADGAWNDFWHVTPKKKRKGKTMSRVYMNIDN